MDSFIALIYTFLIYLPGSTRGYFIRLVIAVVVYGLVMGRSISAEKNSLLRKVSIGMFLSPIISIIPVMLFEQLDLDMLIKELIRMAYCVISINVMIRIKVSDRILYFCALIALVPNYVIQMMEYLKIGKAVEFVQKYYVTDNESWRHLVSATYSGLDFRSGSIFINPNVYMIIPLISLCIFFYWDRYKSSVINNIFIIIAAMSGLLTGSRTAIVVMFVIMTIYYFRYSSAKSRIVFLLATVFIIVRYGNSIMSNSRALQLTVDDSAGYKFASIFWYFRASVSMPLYWIIGGLGSNASAIMDNEIGRIIAWYGIYGVFWYISYYKIIWYNNASIEFYSRLITIVIALVSMTASVMLCMPIYSIVCLFAFSEINGEYDTCLVKIRNV